MLPVAGRRDPDGGGSRIEHVQTAAEGTHVGLECRNVIGDRFQLGIYQGRQILLQLLPIARQIRAHAVAVALEARRLVELRDRWLNPPEWVEWVDEPVAGYPKRPVPRDEATAQALKKRTLTKLYNARPQWLADAHDALDAAVAAAYRWSADITDDDALRELLKLNRGDECSLVRPPAANGESLTFSGYCRHRGTAYARPPSAKADAGCVFRLRHGPLCQDVTHTLPER